MKKITIFINGLRGIRVASKLLGDNLLIDELEENIKAYLDWGFLNIGGYINVSVPTSGLYGGTFHELKTVSTKCPSIVAAYAVIRNL